jgi:hypothetical protein
MATQPDDGDGITPRMTLKQHQDLRKVTLDDLREFHPSLPALKTNSKQGATDPSKLCEECRSSPYLDLKAYGKNRQLAEEIKAAFERIRPSDKDGPHFVLAWRLYPIKDHPRFNVLDGCSCGRGDTTL